MFGISLICVHGVHAATIRDGQHTQSKNVQPPLHLAQTDPKKRRMEINRNSARRARQRKAAEVETLRQEVRVAEPCQLWAAALAACHGQASSAGERRWHAAQWHRLRRRIALHCTTA